jgi:hypothetical protein
MMQRISGEVVLLFAAAHQLVTTLLAWATQKRRSKLRTVKPEELSNRQKQEKSNENGNGCAIFS